MRNLFSATLVIFLCISQISTLAQEYVRPGYIVTNSGDTIKGFIHDREWTKSPSVIEFQRDKSGPIETHSVKDIVAFSTSRPTLYERLPIKYDGNSQSGRNFPNTRIPTLWIEDTLFLEALVKGEFSLYQIHSPGGRRQFVIRQKENTPQELMFRKYISTVDGNRMMRTSEEWKQQLIAYSSGCESIKSKVLKADYKEADIKKLVEELNTCRGGKPVSLYQEIAVETKKPRLGVVAQFFYFSSAAYLATTSFGTVNYGVGVSYEVFSKRRPNRLSIYSELRYRSVDQPTNYGAMDFKTTSIKMVNMARFSYPAGKAIAFWNVGINNGYRLNVKIARGNAAGLPGDYNGAIDIGLAGGFGGAFILGAHSRLSVEARYELEENFSKSKTALSSDIISLLIGYQF